MCKKNKIIQVPTINMFTNLYVNQIRSMQTTIFIVYLFIFLSTKIDRITQLTGTTDRTL